MTYILHTFRPTETIDAVIRLLGRHDYTREELLVLRAEFNELNGLAVPRAGQVFKIPIQSVGVVAVDGPVVSDPKADCENPADDQK